MTHPDLETISSEPPLLKKRVQLEKVPGKGGWTYARIPEIPQDKKNPFGWRKVKGSIDGYEIKQYHLMPMGEGQLFLPVKASIRKSIKKEVGDWVEVVLFPDDASPVTEEFLLCLEDDPAALRNFKRLSESDQKKYIDWIYSAKKEEGRIERIARAIEKIANGVRIGKTQ